MDFVALGLSIDFDTAGQHHKHLPAGIAFVKNRLTRIELLYKPLCAFGGCHRCFRQPKNGNDSNLLNLQNFQCQNFVNSLASALRHVQLNIEQLHLAKQAHPIFFNDDGVRPLEQLEALFLSGGEGSPV